jgi:hypothetical protein
MIHVLITMAKGNNKELSICETRSPWPESPPSLRSKVHIHCCLIGLANPGVAQTEVASVV